MVEKSSPDVLALTFFSSFFALLLSSFWTTAVVTSVVPFPPPVLAFIFFIAHRVSATPLLVEFSSRIAISRYRAFRESICAQEEAPMNVH